jgi:hypothetical protein
MDNNIKEKLIKVFKETIEDLPENFEYLLEKSGFLDISINLFFNDYQENIFYDNWIIECIFENGKLNIDGQVRKREWYVDHKLDKEVLVDFEKLLDTPSKKDFIDKKGLDHV